MDISTWWSMHMIQHVVVMDGPLNSTKTPITRVVSTCLQHDFVRHFFVKFRSFQVKFLILHTCKYLEFWCSAATSTFIKKCARWHCLHKCSDEPLFYEVTLKSTKLFGRSYWHAHMYSNFARMYMKILLTAFKLCAWCVETSTNARVLLCGTLEVCNFDARI